MSSWWRPLGQEPGKGCTAFAEVLPACGPGLTGRRAHWPDLTPSQEAFRWISIMEATRSCAASFGDRGPGDRRRRPRRHRPDPPARLDRQVVRDPLPVLDVHRAHGRQPRRPPAGSRSPASRAVLRRRRGRRARARWPATSSTAPSACPTRRATSATGPSRSASPRCSSRAPSWSRRQPRRADREPLAGAARHAADVRDAGFLTVAALSLWRDPARAPLQDGRDERAFRVPEAGSRARAHLRSARGPSADRRGRRGDPRPARAGAGARGLRGRRASPTARRRCARPPRRRATTS